MFAAAFGFSVGHAGAPSGKSTPSFAVIQQAVGQYFAKLDGYKPGEIISRNQVEPLFAELKKLGWEVTDQEEVLKLVPGDDEFLVTQLRTPDGRKLMSQMHSAADVDRLDRLTKLPRGRQIAQDLVVGPDGYKMLDYMTKTQGGRELGRMLSQDPQGGNFNEPTGRIYLEQQLIGRLKQSYDAATLPAASRITQ